MEDLAGRTILLVEDEYLIASHLAAELERAGASVIGPVADAEEALAVLSEGATVELAVVDLNLRGCQSFDVADRLLARQIPFIIQTGYQCHTLPDRFSNVPCVGKPCDERELIKLLAALVAGSTVAPSGK